MKKPFARVMGVLAIVLAVAGCGHFIPQQGWTRLIDGNAGMENWDILGGGNWRAQDGAIQADKTSTKGASILVSKKSYKNVEVYVEFWAADDTNSGVYVRAPNPQQVNTASGAYEVQIWDKNPNPAYSTGSLVNVAAVQPVHKAAGRWNTFEIYANGPEITVKMNGVITASIRDGKTHDGRIGLQFNGGPIKVRKLYVKEL